MGVASSNLACLKIACKKPFSIPVSHSRRPQVGLTNSECGANVAVVRACLALRSAERKQRYLALSVQRGRLERVWGLQMHLDAVSFGIVSSGSSRYTDI